jgi:hypothetical protein
MDKRAERRRHREHHDRQGRGDVGFISTWARGSVSSSSRLTKINYGMASDLNNTARPGDRRACNNNCSACPKDTVKLLNLPISNQSSSISRLAMAAVSGSRTRMRSKIRSFALIGGFL